MLKGPVSWPTHGSPGWPDPVGSRAHRAHPVQGGRGRGRPAPDHRGLPVALSETGHWPVRRWTPRLPATDAGELPSSPWPRGCESVSDVCLWDLGTKVLDQLRDCATGPRVVAVPSTCRATRTRRWPAPGVLASLARSLTHITLASEWVRLERTQSTAWKGTLADVDLDGLARLQRGSRRVAGVGLGRPRTWSAPPSIADWPEFSVCPHSSKTARGCRAASVGDSRG